MRHVDPGRHREMQVRSDISEKGGRIQVLSQFSMLRPARRIQRVRVRTADFRMPERLHVSRLKGLSMPLDTIQFKASAECGGAYKCSQPGDMSGEYVRSEVARALHEQCLQQASMLNRLDLQLSQLLARVQVAALIEETNEQDKH